MLVSVNGSANVNITASVNNGDFYLNEGMLKQIAGAKGFAPGSNTVTVEAIDESGKSNSTTVTLNLQTAAPATPTVTVDPTSLGTMGSSGYLGTLVNTIGGVDLTNPNAATSATVTLDVTTTANEVVQLYQAGDVVPLDTETADSNGNVVFSSVALSAGVNNFVAQAEDNAGNISQLSTLVVLSQAPVAATNNVAKTQTSVSAGTSSSVLNLADGFTNPNGGNTIVLLNTSSGPAYLEMRDTATPQTVANFLAYINNGDYNNAVLSRLCTWFRSAGRRIHLAEQSDQPEDDHDARSNRQRAEPEQQHEQPGLRRHSGLCPGQRLHVGQLQREQRHRSVLLQPEQQFLECRQERQQPRPEFHGLCPGAFGRQIALSITWRTRPYTTKASTRAT